MTRAAVVLGLLLGPACFPGRAADEGRRNLRKLPAAAPGKIDFQRDIRPIFTRACLSCHGPDKPRAGLRLDSRAVALKGSEAGPVIRPGDAAHSRLLHVVAGLDPEVRMPPKGKRLTRAEISRLRAWIDQGAAWPRGLKLAAAPEVRHWAFLPPRRPPLPRVSTPAWVRNGIDAFVLARLDREKFRPSPEADRVTLLRRLYLDLLGLPPTPTEVDAFLQDRRRDAYERLVDRLLASPHYGERWGRHWLDLARYADSDGFEKDKERPHAWRYRQWVIEALNRDLPYDEYVIEQLAGDLLPGATVEQQVATGFHRNALTNEECGVDKEQFRVEQVVDRTNTTATVFLGLTLACAQCHDHKYDPFSQKEYYQLFAFFNGQVEKDIPAPLAWERAAYQKARAEFDKKEAELEGGLAEYKQNQLPLNQRKWEKGLTPAEVRELPAPIRAILATPARRRSPQQKKVLADYYTTEDATLDILKGLLEEHRKQAPKVGLAPILVEGKGRPTHVLLRGDFLKPGARVQPGVPAVLPPLRSPQRPTRLDLAHWIVTPTNPLAARVAVNRLWQRHFGRGLVGTPDDFGTRGEKPTHPELLDWLAAEFVRRGWSLKAMHRLIVCSATYRQSSVVRDDLQRRDPHNLLVARQSRLRLEAEVIRDVALASSGLLRPVVGGPSVRPPQPAGVSEVTFDNNARWVESKGAERYRRGLYTFFRRTSPYPSLLTFDAPDSNTTCTRRARTNTPLQALVLLNDTVHVEAAQALARRVLRAEAGDAEARVRHAFRLCLAREPSGREARRLAELYAAQLRLCRAHRRDAARLAGPDPVPEGVTVPELASWVAVGRVVMNLDEFITRE